NTGTTAGDSSGNGLHGTLVGNPGLPTWTAGQFASALQFNGGQDRVQVGHNAVLNSTTGYTISLGIKAPSGGGIAPPDDGDAGAPRGVLVPIILDKSLQFNDNAGWQIGVGGGD